jgi:Tfp pilus assembly protein PilX
MISASVGQVCNNTMASLNMNPAVLPWTIGAGPVGVYYIPTVGATTMTISSTGGQTAGIDNYYSKPAYYIGYLGSTTTNRITSTYYQIDAVGYGSSPDTAAVVESTYMTTTDVPCLSCQ